MPNYDEDPDLSPENHPTGDSKPTGVKRVNNIPLMILVFVVAIFFTIIADHLYEISNPKTVASSEVKENHGNSLKAAESITGNHNDGMVPALQQAPVSSLQSLIVPIAVPDDLETPPLPPGAKKSPANTQNEERLRQSKEQLFENAVKAKTGVQFQDNRTRSAMGDANNRRDETLQRIAGTQQLLTEVQKNDPSTAYKTRLAQLQGSDSADDGAPHLLEKTSSDHNNFSQFDAKGKGNRWQLDSQEEAPPTPYVLRAGFVIPATMISGINSDLPGQITGQVSQNVFDTASGKYLLIPQGARLVGSYGSEVAYGQSRVLVAWQRIVFPDGKAMDIGAMPGADSAGYGGFSDQVDNHYLRIFGSAFLMSGITAGISYSQNNNNNNSVYAQPNAQTAMSEALGQQLGTVTSQMISKNLSISPTLEIRPGFRFNVMCIKDMIFNRPYQSFDY